MLFYRLISNSSKTLKYVTLSLLGCQTVAPNEPTQDVLQGNISYPFVDETSPLGKDRREEPFVIKSAIGNREYMVEIPGGARDYDVQVPLAEMTPLGSEESDPLKKSGINPIPTDHEMIASLPQLSKQRPADTALMDAAFGTGDAQGPTQAPSYTLGIARINDYYRKRQFELCLVELNQLLAFYPNSPQLLKMKGTVLLKMRNLALAEIAWSKAISLAPKDQALQKALDRLRKQLQK